MTSRIFFLLWLYASSTACFAQQVINAYAKVTAISGTSLTISDVNETYDNFSAGESVIIMQMQDNVIGSNTGNNSGFGDLSTISNAGLFEAAVISDISTVSSRPVIWNETFNDLTTGSTSDNGTTSWSRTCNGGCNGSVSTTYTTDGSRAFAFNDNGGYWYSGEIDISGYTNVGISMNVAQSGYDAGGGVDRLTVSYSLNGGTSYTDISALTRNFAATTVSVSGLSGSTVIIRVYVDNDANEYGIFDNIVVEGDYSATILQVTESLINSYTIGNNASVQIISFPKFSSYTTTSALTALPWDGNVGGVFALEVTGTLTLEHSISVDALGFAGGTSSDDVTDYDCESTTYISSSSDYGRKGEGVYKSTNSNYSYARGKIATGGGGGSHHNSGGGGGGNFTAGGDGGPGYNLYNSSTGCDPGAGGIGGLDLSAYIASDRIFMGGGGGGGQQNNSMSADGGEGGGIVIIRAGTLKTNSGCSSGLQITANGEDVGDTDADGGGGAGAGGSILFDVDNWSLSCDLAIEATGGDGSSVTNADIHGGGGGGGKGVIIFSGAMPTDYLTVDNSEGEGGNKNGSGSSSAANGDTAPSDPDADADGVVESDPATTLPVELIEWGGVCIEQTVFLSWATLTEESNDYFTLYRSSDGTGWEEIATIQGHGTTSERQEYAYEDAVVKDGIMYYQLSQTDYDGRIEKFEIIAVETELLGSNILLYPNPSKGSFSLVIPAGMESENINIWFYTSGGKSVTIPYHISETRIDFNSEGLPPGNYLLKVMLGNVSKTIQVMLR